MAKLKDLETKPPKILLYGDPGTGKTALALTLGERLEIMDFEGGLMTGVKLQDEFQNKRMAVEASQFLDDKPSKADAFRQAKSHLYKIANQASQGKYPYQALCIDSLTSLADSAVRFVLGNSGKLGENPQIQHWGLAFTEIENFLNIARSMNIVLILTAHVQNVEVDEAVQKSIDIPGRKLPSKVTRYFDEIWYAKVKGAGKERRHVLQTKSTGSLVTRSRYELADDTKMDLGLEKILSQLGYEFPSKDQEHPEADKT